MIAGVVELDEGAVLIDDEDMSRVEAEHRGIGMAFQNFALFPHMNAFDNIASPLTVGKLSAESVKAGVDKVAKLLKIDHVLSHTPRELSNGQKQRTALARALAGSPPILLLDDPLRNVDAKLRYEMRLELPQLLSKQGATVVYVTQDYKEAMALGNRIAVMAAGKIQQIGSPADIYLTPATLEIARLFGDPVINLFDVVGQRDQSGVFVELSGTRLSLDESEAGCVDTEAVLGIRPESIVFVPQDTEDAIPITIEAETPLNEKVVTLALTERGREMLISRPSGNDAPAAGRAFVSINQQALLLFDRATGQRLHESRTVVKDKSGVAA
jgi:multiple sugar transport system ATP-binding protein